MRSQIGKLGAYGLCPVCKKSGVKFALFVESESEKRWNQIERHKRIWLVNQLPIVG